jgi:hypothetical protein
MTVADGTIYPRNFHVEIGYETLTVSTTGSGTSVPVRRAQQGSNASVHSSGDTVLINPNFLAVEIIDAINYAQADAFPYIYKDVLDTSLTTATNTFEYTIPSIDSIAMKYVSQVEIKPTGESDYRMIRDYSIRRGATPKIQLMWEPASGGSLRIHGYNPFPDVTLGGNMDTRFPANAVLPIVIGAASYLTASGEAGRLRADTGIIDQRESANRAGSSLSFSNSLYQRFRTQIAESAIMPRLPIHAKPTF